MKITAQLALSQMKVKKRTIAAMSITVISNIFSANVAYIRQMYKCQCCCGTCCILRKWYSCCVSFKSIKI